MTKVRISFAAALGFLAAGLIAAPAAASPLNIAKPTVTADRHADLHLVDRGSWKKKQYFKSKKRYFKKKKKHFRGDRYYDGGYYGDHNKYRKRKKYRRAYRDGYDQGYYEGRRGGYYDDYRPRFRSRGGHRHRHRYGGSGYIKTPGFYFRF